MRKIGPVVLAVVIALGGSGGAPASEPDVSARVEPGLLAATAPLDVLARFDDRIPTDLDGIAGLSVNYRFGAVPAVYATVTPAAARALAEHPSLAYLETDKPIEFDLDTATVASRSKDVTDPAFDPETPALTTPDGDVIDGSGVGIAIVDTGLDGLHPDYQEPGKVAGNYYVTPAGPVPFPWTSNTTVESGHGTHVAGIAAGLGTLSEQQGGPVYRGVAPGASLYTFDVFMGALSTASMAFDWILQNGASQNPPIRIVNNSWHCGSFLCRNPTGGEMLHVTLATQLANDGFTVTWAAGNDIGDGWFSTVSEEATNQTPGIISVGNYHDENSGRRDLCMSSSSAWGASSDPTTWPDLAAPGRSIKSTWAFGVDRTGTAGLDYRDPLTNANAYKDLTGTSMSAPHVAGIVALLLEANPDLTPGEIEYILKQTATPLTGTDDVGCGLDYYRADASHPWTGANYVAGHGLVHAYDAVDLALGFGSIPAPVPTEALPDDFKIVRPGVEVDETFYLAGDASLQQDYPTSDQPRVKLNAPNTPLVFTGEPLTDGFSTGVVKMDVYLGTFSEAFASITPPRILTSVAAIRNGTPIEIAEHREAMWQIYAALPNHRDFQVVLDEPFTFEPGDQIRFTVSVIAPPLSGIDPPPEAFWTLYWERPTTSRVSFGHVVPKPDVNTRASCESRQDCALLDETHEYEGMTCGSTTYSLSWFGPPGSALIFSCESAHATCVVPGMPGDPWGTCEMEYEATVVRVYKAGVCTYRMPDGTRGGSGRCVGHTLIEDDD